MLAHSENSKGSAYSVCQSRNFYVLGYITLLCPNDGTDSVQSIGCAAIRKTPGIQFLLLYAANKVESARPTTHDKHSIGNFVRFVSIATGLELV